MKKKIEKKNKQLINITLISLSTQQPDDVNDVFLFFNCRHTFFSYSYSRYAKVLDVFLPIKSIENQIKAKKQKKNYGDVLLLTLLLLRSAINAADLFKKK